ncbi:hypothetical protein FRC03_003567 [Tulasnella sp. 419]|nr:hypothetical protein FRC02_002970 [Tulasnella sp. 418]KAG8942175.1 hypothetical protein FRC03_003567 [Tulasnella sp. 419]
MAKAPKGKRKLQTHGFVNTTRPALGARKKTVSWICSCGCGKYIKDKRTELRHLDGIGPSYVRVVHALKNSNSEPPFGPHPSPQPASTASGHESELTISPPSSPLASMTPASPNADFPDNNDILGPANDMESHDQDELDRGNTNTHNTEWIPSTQRVNLESISRIVHSELDGYSSDETDEGDAEKLDSDPEDADLEWVREEELVEAEVNSMREELVMEACLASYSMFGAAFEIKVAKLSDYRLLLMYFVRSFTDTPLKENRGALPKRRWNIYKHSTTRLILVYPQTLLRSFRKHSQSYGHFRPSSAFSPALPVSQEYRHAYMTAASTHAVLSLGTINRLITAHFAAKAGTMLKEKQGSTFPTYQSRNVLHTFMLQVIPQSR